jgi:hypothetical protein
MTISEILGMDIDTLESLSKEELEEYCKPFLNITRPDLAKKHGPMAGLKKKIRKPSGSGGGTMKGKNAAFLEGLKILAETGDMEAAKKASKGEIK